MARGFTLTEALTAIEVRLLDASWAALSDCRAGDGSKNAVWHDTEAGTGHKTVLDAFKYRRSADAV